MRRWKLFGFALLVGIALAGPSLNAGAIQKDAKSASPLLVLAR